uniref:Cation efflux protein transmembrane domain-containing protein n=1 Tax=Nelumbo nucifera TaxID=4432 RepID=A0A822ZK90_NELNU|nr:TPA_asm: hypothetical protein HUJ06_002241 [Nelumbo nucifera]
MAGVPTVSSGYTSGLLHRTPAEDTEMESANQSWRLNLEEFQLPEQQHQEDPRPGFSDLLRCLRKQGKVAKYYRRQEKLLKGFNEMEAVTEYGSLPGHLTEDEQQQLARSERMAVHASNIANIVLFMAKVYASVESRSLAVIASTLDSFMDLLSGFILWFTDHAMRKPNHYRYPIGKQRMQPLVSLPSFLLCPSKLMNCIL